MSSYWQKRAEQRLISAEDKARRLEKKLKSRFNKVYRNIDSEIAKIYYEFADENGLNYSIATKRLTKKEKERFLKELDYYIENSTDEEYVRKLKDKYKGIVTKLDAKKISIETEVNKLYEEYFRTELQLTLDDILHENYYRSIFDGQQFLGFGVSFTTLSPLLLTSLLEYPWSGKNYSEKIWGHVKNFSGKLEDILTIGIVQGTSNQKMAAELAKACDVEYKKALALVRTETNFIANEATSRGYEQLGVTSYRYLATLDLRTSEKCRGLDGKIFTLEEKKVGVNYPPTHTHCRSTTVPELDEEIEGTRIARRGDGSTYKVDRNMSYKEWYNKYVAADQKELGVEKAIKNKSADKQQYKNYVDTLGNNAPKTFDDFTKIKYNKLEEYNALKSAYRSTRYDASAYIKSDKQKKNVVHGRQNKHIVGTNEYRQYVNKLKEKGEYGPGTITIPFEKIEELVAKYAGNGEMMIKKDKSQRVERITDYNEIIGTVVNNLTGKSIETSNFKIHYSSKGVHIVPDYPSKGV